MTKTTVAWCQKCKLYVSAPNIGWECPARDCTAILVKRVGYLCDDCGERPFFKTRKEIAAHRKQEHEAV